MEDKISLKKFPADFSLEEFARAYVEEAILAARENLDSDTFDNRVYNRVSERVGVSPQAVTYLSHPFHWEFFCYSNGDAILKYNQINRALNSETSRLSSGRISLAKEPSPKDIEHLVDIVLNGSESSRVKPSTPYFKLSCESSLNPSSPEINERRLLFQARIEKVGIDSSSNQYA